MRFCVFQLEASKMVGTHFDRRLFWKMSSAMFIGGFAIFLLLYTTQPLFPIFSEQFEVSPAIASLSLSVSTATLAIAMLFTAGVSERFGKKQIMTLSLITSALLTVFSAFSPSFSTLLGLRVLLGITIAGLPAIAMAYIVEEFPKRTIGLAMGLYLAGNTIGGMTGRILTGILADYFSWKIALLFVGALSLLCGVVFWRLLPNPRYQKKQTKLNLHEMFHPLFEHLKNVRLLCLYGLAFLLMGGFVTLYNYVTYYLLGAPYYLSHTFVSWIFLLYIMGTISSTVMGRLADRIGRMTVLVIGLVLMLGGILLTLHPHLFIKTVAIALFTYGFFSCHTVASSSVGMNATHHKAHASSLYLLFYYTGSSVFGTVGGFFWNRYEWYGVTSFISALILSGFLLTLCLFVLQSNMKKSAKHNLN